MKNRAPALFALALISLLLIPGLARAAEGFLPSWQVGESWTLEARYRDLAKADEAWLPPIRWTFSVRNRKEIEGVPCYVLHVTPADREDLRVQAILCLAEADLRLVKAVDVFPGRGRIMKRERRGDESRFSPLLRNGSLVPYDLPLFPLAAGGEERDNAAAVGAEKSVSVDGLTFVEEITQEWVPVDGGYRITLKNPVSDGWITQTWKEGLPWAESMQSHTLSYRLVQEDAATEGE